MNRLRENPVARQLSRRETGLRYWGPVLLALVGSIAAGIAMQAFWIESAHYSRILPRVANRLLSTTLLALGLVLLPWAAARGACLWRLTQVQGLLDEYRRTRLSSAGIVAGISTTAVRPLVMVLICTFGMALGASFSSEDLTPGQVFTVHLLLAAQLCFYLALGMWFGGRFRYPSIAIGLAWSVLAIAVGMIWFIDPFYRTMGDPSPWIYAALLPNPVTAIGNAMNTDVLRFSWIYAHVHAHEYFFVYPPAWQTALLYAGTGALVWNAVRLRLARSER